MASLITDNTGYTGHLWKGSTSHRYKGPVMRKAFLCYGVSLGLIALPVILSRSSSSSCPLVHLSAQCCADFSRSQLQRLKQTLHWRYMGIIMTSQIISDSPVCSTVCSSVRQRNHQKLHVVGPLWGKPSVTGVLPSQRAGKSFVIMTS